MQQNESRIKEYEKYAKTVLNSAFDFETWHQHQYGTIPNVKVKTDLSINVVGGQKSAK